MLPGREYPLDSAAVRDNKIALAVTTVGLACALLSSGRRVTHEPPRTACCCILQ